MTLSEKNKHHLLCHSQHTSVVSNNERNLATNSTKLNGSLMFSCHIMYNTSHTGLGEAAQACSGNWEFHFHVHNKTPFLYKPGPVLVWLHCHFYSLIFDGFSFYSLVKGQLSFPIG